MNETIILLKWLLVFSATGLLGSLLFVSENSKMLRYTVGKALGIILLAAVTWLLSLFHILPFTSLVIWLVLLVLLFWVIYKRKKYLLKFFKDNLKQILLIEVIILSLFFIFVSARMLSPKIEGVEKFMDMAILTGLMRHDKGIPLDTWYAPSSINYYYFGHWVVAAWAKLSFVSANYAFNLGYASILSLVGGMIFALAHKLSGKLFAGFMAIFFALFASNIFSFIAYAGGKTIDFFQSGRFVDQVINEYPLYSIVLGDLHAHMLGLILSVALFGLLAIVADKQSEKSARTIYIIIGGLLGLMALTNSFDIINCGVLLAVYFLWELYIRKTKLRILIKRGLAIVAPFATILIISMITFSPAVSGIQISLFKTPLIHIFWQFGVVLLLFVISACIILLQPKPKKYLKQLSESHKFLIIVFAASAIALILITELLYFKDIYHYENPPYARANTQFKIWYSAWIMLAIAATAIYGEAWGYVKNKYYKIALVLIGMSAVTVAGVGTIAGYSYLKNSNVGDKHTLNGTYYLLAYNADKLAVINYINENITGQPIILQNGGDSYSTNSWLSSYTGTASYLGWRTHEWGWRYNEEAWQQITNKYSEIKQTYESTTSADFKNNLNKTSAKYVLIGPDENGVFNINQNIVNKVLGQPIFTSGEYKLYAVKNN